MVDVDAREEDKKTGCSTRTAGGLKSNQRNGNWQIHRQLFETKSKNLKEKKVVSVFLLVAKAGVRARAVRTSPVRRTGTPAGFIQTAHYREQSEREERRQTTKTSQRNGNTWKIPSDPSIIENHGNSLGICND